MNITGYKIKHKRTDFFFTSLLKGQKCCPRPWTSLQMLLLLSPFCLYYCHTFSLSFISFSFIHITLCIHTDLLPITEPFTSCPAHRLTGCLGLVWASDSACAEVLSAPTGRPGQRWAAAPSSAPSDRCVWSLWSLRREVSSALTCCWLLAQTRQWTPMCCFLMWQTF